MLFSWWYGVDGWFSLDGWLLFYAVYIFSTKEWNVSLYSSTFMSHTPSPCHPTSPWPPAYLFTLYIRDLEVIYRIFMKILTRYLKEYMRVYMYMTTIIYVEQKCNVSRIFGLLFIEKQGRILHSFSYFIILCSTNVCNGSWQHFCFPVLKFYQQVSLKFCIIYRASFLQFLIYA